MRNIAYKILDYFYEHDTARAVWMHVSILGLALAALGLPWWQYALVILFAALMQWHGLVDGAKSVTDIIEGKDK